MRRTCRSAVGSGCAGGGGFGRCVVTCIAAGWQQDGSRMASCAHAWKLCSRAAACGSVCLGAAAALCHSVSLFVFLAFTHLDCRDVEQHAEQAVACGVRHLPRHLRGTQQGANAISSTERCWRWHAVFHSSIQHHSIRHPSIQHPASASPLPSSLQPGNASPLPSSQHPCHLHRQQRTPQHARRGHHLLQRSHQRVPARLPRRRLLQPPP